MAKRKVSGIVLMLFLMGAVGLTFNTKPVKASETIYIRADGSIDPTTVAIKREGDLYTLTNDIDAVSSGIVIERDNIILNGFGFRIKGNGAYAPLGNAPLFISGVYIDSRVNITIRNIVIVNFFDGIALSGSSNSTITQCNITGNNFGVSLSSDCAYNIVSDNNLYANADSAIDVEMSSDNIIVGNNITAQDSRGVLLVNSSSNTIYGNNITGNTTASSHGIWLEGASTNIITGNRIAKNNEGITLKCWTDFSKNPAINFPSSYNNVSGNTITENQFGIRLEYTSNNFIYNNSFVNNTVQAYAMNCANTWDDGYTGNYWSNYNGSGSTPFIIDANNQDHHPLVYGEQNESSPPWFVAAAIIATVAGGTFLVYLTQFKKTTKKRVKFYPTKRTTTGMTACHQKRQGNHCIPGFAYIYGFQNSVVGFERGGMRCNRFIFERILMTIER